MREIEELSLLNVLEGYVRNYRKLNLYENTNTSMFTRREIDYFATVGEYLGFFSFVEDTKPNHDYGRSRPMDLAWWKFDEKISSEEFSNLVLHLERENLWAKDMETVEKLFCKTDIEYTPDYVVGIMRVESQKRIKKLQSEVKKRNMRQQSEALMIYSYDEDRKVEAHYLSFDSKREKVKKIVSETDNTGYWMMCFEEEYKNED